MEDKYIFLDTETTGLLDEDRLVEVGYRPAGHPSISQRFKAELPVKFGAMAVNHISNTMLKDCERFEGSDMQATLKKFADEGYILVAHNAPFDIKMLEKDGVFFKNYIDTKKMSHALDPDEEMESHRLQYLRYYHGVELPHAEAHTAEGDIAVLEAVFHKLNELLGNKTPEELMEMSRLPVLHTKFKFGKYNGNSIESVASINPGYLEWMLEQKKNSDQNEEDWIYTLEHYLNN